MFDGFRKVVYIDDLLATGGGLQTDYCQLNVTHYAYNRYCLHLILVMFTSFVEIFYTRVLF